MLRCKYLPLMLGHPSLLTWSGHRPALVTVTLFQVSFSSISALSQHTASDRRSLKYFVLFDDQYLLPEKKRFSELADEKRSRDPVINTNKSLPITQNHESPGHFPLPGWLPGPRHCAAHLLTDRPLLQVTTLTYFTLDKDNQNLVPENL